MARKRGSKGKGRDSESSRNHDICDRSDEGIPGNLVSKTISKGQVGGIPPLSFDDAEDLEECLLTPEQTIQELQQRSAAKNQLSEWLSVLKSKEVGCSAQHRASASVEGKSVQSNVSVLQLSEDDVEDELNYWWMSVVVYVMGLNPYISTFEGYCKRICGEKNVDKVIPVKKGVFLIRFLNVETKEEALRSSHLMFDRRPVFVKQWEDGMDFDESFNRIPIWIQMPNLPLKFWGENCMKKIVGLVGRPIKADSATSSKERIAFARFLVEMNIHDVYPEQIEFMDEKGNLIFQSIKYEWRPLYCSKCKGLGHTGDKCKTKEVRQEWRRKEAVVTEVVVEDTVVEQISIQQDVQPTEGGGAMGVEVSGRIIQKVGNPVRLRNSFTGLQMVDEIQFGMQDAIPPSHGGEEGGHG